MKEGTKEEEETTDKMKGQISWPIYLQEYLFQEELAQWTQ